MDDPIWRTLSTGRCFIYVLPCREQDTLKIGYARDPWARMSAFHPRFHAFFDLDRAALIETDRVRDARVIERSLKQQFSSAADLAPLQVRERAGGKFEWFRGIHPRVMDELETLSVDLGYPMHAPLSGWLRDQWLTQIERLTDWTVQEYEQIEAWHFNADPVFSKPREVALRNLLDAWQSIDLPFEVRLPDQVRAWYRDGFEQ